MNNNELAIMQDCYQVLANIHNHWRGRHTSQGQGLLCRLRDTIAEETGVSAEQVQDNVNHDKLPE